MEIAVDGQSNIIQYGSGVGVPEGCTLVELDDAQEQALMAILDAPNGGVTFSAGVFTVLPVPAPQPVVDPLASQKAALESAVSADVQAGKMSLDTATALQNLLNAMAPK